MRAPALFLSAVLVSGGCGTVSVMSTDPSARLYAGGRMLGQGTGQLTRRGTPESTTIVAVSQDGRRSQTVVKREFTGFTFLTGLFTYGICLVFCWEYPSVVLVGAPPQGGYASGSASYAAGPDPWLLPPPGYQPPAAPPDSLPPAAPPTAP
ncbi:MAG TPA: hypothetical protein VGG33_06035 [Polyangia bacterium]